MKFLVKVGGFELSNLLLFSGSVPCPSKLALNLYLDPGSLLFAYLQASKAARSGQPTTASP